MRLKNLESRAFLVAVILTTVAFIWLVRGFLMPVFWAAVLAVLFRPASNYWNGLLPNRRNTAATLTTITVTLTVLIPVSLLILAVAQQAIRLYQRIAAGEVDLQAPIDYAERQLPLITEFLGGYGIDIATVRASVENVALSISQYIASQALTLGQNALLLTVMFALMLYFLYFFIRDGDVILDAIVRALPLGDVRERTLFAKFAEVTRATIKGTFIVASVQGAIGGVMFWIVGIEGAVFWGVVMGLLSLFPAVGAFLVWAPAAIYFFVVGTWWKAIFLVLTGALGIGLIDNILRPILVGRETKMPDYLVLLATLGGLAAFGLSGFVLGPVIAALFLVVWDMFASDYARLDSSEAVPQADAPPDADAAEKVAVADE